MKNWYLATYKKTDGTYGNALVLTYPPNNPAPCRIEETMVK